MHWLLAQHFRTIQQTNIKFPWGLIRIYTTGKWRRGLTRSAQVLRIEKAGRKLGSNKWITFSEKHLSTFSHWRSCLSTQSCHFLIPQNNIFAGLHRIDVILIPTIMSRSFMGKIKMIKFRRGKWEFQAKLLRQNGNWLLNLQEPTSHWFIQCGLSPCNFRGLRREPVGCPCTI